MSTKTSIKRIALVAAAALTLGGFSAITTAGSAQAAGVNASAGTAGWYVQTAYSTTNKTAIVGGYAQVVFVGDTATAGESWSIALTGVGSISTAALGATTVTSDASNKTLGGGTITYPATSLQFTESSTVIADANVAAINDAQKGMSDTITVSSGVVGTTTLTATKLSNGSPTSTTASVTITWVSAATTAVSVQYTQSGSVAGSGAVTLGTIATISADKATGTQAATLQVKEYDGGNNDISSTQVITASVTGPGTIGVGNSTSQASAGRAVTGSAGNSIITVWPDGTAGVSTITVSDGTTVLKTFTVTFTGATAKVTPTQNLYVAQAGTTLGHATAAYALTGSTVTNTYAVDLVNTDSAGNVVATGKAGTIKVVPADTTIISTGACTEDSATATTGVSYHCSVTAAAGAVSGATTTVKFGVLNADGTTYTYSSDVTFKIGGAVKTTAMSLDKAEYSANSPIVITISAKDVSGNAAYDQDYTFLSVAAVSTTYLGGNVLPGTGSYTLINGKHDFKGNYAPIAGSSFTISATDATAALAAISATASVTGTAGDSGSLALDAANAATDAANNAYDEAQNATQAAQDALAAVTALAAQVKSLIASVKSLTALVSKIKAKVGA